MIVRELVGLLRLQSNPQDFNRAESGMSKIIGFAKAAGTAFAGLKLAQWIKGVANETAKLGDQFDKMSLRTGVASTTLQELSHAAQLSGTSIEAVEVSIKTLARAQDEAATGAAEYADEFKRLGVDVKKTDGTLKSFDEILPEIAGGLKGLKTDTERAAVASKLFGRSGTQLLPMLKDGADGLRAMMQEAQELGGVIDDELRGASTEYLDNQQRMSMAFQGIRNVVAKNLLPAFVRMQERFLKWFKLNREWIAQKVGTVFKKLGQVIENVSGFISDATDAAAEWLKGLSPLESTLAKLRIAIAAIAIVLMLPMGPIILLIALIALIIDDFMVWRKGGDSLIGDLVDGFKQVIDWLNNFFDIDLAQLFKDWWTSIKAWVDLAINLIGSLAQFIYDIFDKGIGQAWDNLMQNLSQAWTEFVAGIKPHFDNFVGIFVKIWNAVYAWLKDNIIEPIANLFGWLWDKIKSGVRAAIDAYINMWLGIITWFKDNIIDPIVNLFKGLWDSITDLLGGMKDTITEWAGDIAKKIGAPFKAIGKALGGLFGGGEKPIEVTKEQRTQLLGVAEVVAAGAPAQGALGSPVVTPRAQQAPVVHSSQTSIDIEIKAAPGMNEAALASTVARQVKTAMQQENRMAIKALTPARATAG